MVATKILVVDDEPAQLSSLRENLTDRGFEVIERATAEGAIAAVPETLPDAVVLDFGLGKSTGLDVLRRIRELDKTLPVVLLSGLAEIAKPDLVHEGIDFILNKGDDPRILPELLERLVSRRDHVVSSLEAWADGNPAANAPAFMTSDGRSLTFNEALDEMKRGTMVGRELIEDYRAGVTQIFARGPKPKRT
jgi:DNA-binding response OmpR family regulator